LAQIIFIYLYLWSFWHIIIILGRYDFILALTNNWFWCKWCVIFTPTALMSYSQKLCLCTIHVNVILTIIYYIISKNTSCTYFSNFLQIIFNFPYYIISLILYIIAFLFKFVFRGLNTEFACPWLTRHPIPRMIDVSCIILYYINNLIH